MHTATPRARVQGLKGVSGLSGLMQFNMVQSFVPEYMHGILLGVTKTIMNKWFSPTENGNSYFVGKELKTISARLSHIQPPDFIERLPRDLEVHHNHLKATEYQSWLLFDALPCMDGILPDDYLRHFAHLSEAIHILLGDAVTAEALDRAASLLDTFYKDFATLYSEGSCGINFHNAGFHLVSCIRQWVPLWAWSCFCFEDANAMILQAVHGTGDVTKQVIRFKEVQCVLNKNDRANPASRPGRGTWSNLNYVSDTCATAALQTLKKRLSDKKPHVRFFLEVIETVINAIDSRFQKWFSSREAKLATASSPQFRLWWLPEEEKEDVRRMLVAEALNMEPAVNTTAAAPASSDSGEEDFFSYGPGANRETSTGPPEEEMPFGIFSFGIVIRLKITIGGSFNPDAVQPRTQVKFVLSWPVVLNVMDDSPFLLTVLVRGSREGVADTVVRALMDSPFRLINLKHQDGPPLKFSLFISVATVLAFSRICTKKANTIDIYFHLIPSFCQPAHREQHEILTTVEEERDPYKKTSSA
ncbi:hypothetical protein JOQ06_026635, partial [Pogonophryne albipinna]